MGILFKRGLFMGGGIFGRHFIPQIPKNRDAVPRFPPAQIYCLVYNSRLGSTLGSENRFTKPAERAACCKQLFQ